MSKILLLNPEWKVKGEDNLWGKVASKYPSLGLGYVAAVLQKHNHKVFFVDMLAESMSVEEFKNSYDYCVDFVGITATTPLINNALLIAEIIKKISPSTKVILGGVHPTVKSDEVIQNPNVDIVVRGEGEYTMLEIVENKPLQSIKGITYVENGEIVRNDNREQIKDLNELPVPAFDLMPISKYKPAIGAYKRLPAMSLLTSRGCVGVCSFCYRLFDKPIRFRSAEKIIEEILFLQEKYGIKEISFYDDTFTAIKSNVRKFCELVLEKKLDVTWSCFTRVNYIDEDLFKLMKRAGCHLVLFGVESGNQKILDRMHKMITLKQIREAVKICKRVGLKTRASYILGCLGDTEETIQQTISLSLELDTDYAQYNIMTAYPGTEVWKEAEREGWLVVKDYDYSVSDFSMSLPTIGNDRLMELYKLAHKRFYFRPKILLRHLLDIRSWNDVKQKLIGGLAVALQK